MELLRRVLSKDTAYIIANRVADEVFKGIII